MKKLKDRLSVKIQILQLRVAMGLCYMAMAGDVLQRKSLGLSKKISSSVIPSEPEEPYVHVPSPIDKYTLDLTAWRGPDGEGLTQFAVTSEQAEQIVAVLGDSYGTEDEEVLHPLAKLSAIVGSQEAA